MKKRLSLKRKNEDYEDYKVKKKIMAIKNVFKKYIWICICIYVSVHPFKILNTTLMNNS